MEIDSLKIKRFCELTGYSIDAVKQKISKGVWLNGREYIKINKEVLISIKGYESWVQKSRKNIPANLL